MAHFYRCTPADERRRAAQRVFEQQRAQVVRQGVVDGGFHVPVKRQGVAPRAVIVQAVGDVVLQHLGGASGQRLFLGKVRQCFGGVGPAGAPLAADAPR